MKKAPTRPSLLTRLAASSATECVLAIMTLLLSVVGLRSYFEFQASPASDQITPLAFMFGVWPFVIMFAVGIGAAAWAVEKAR